MRESGREKFPDAYVYNLGAGDRARTVLQLASPKARAICVAFPLNREGCIEGKWTDGEDGQLGVIDHALFLLDHAGCRTEAS
jgi:hypothetical protein